MAIFIVNTVGMLAEARKYKGCTMFCTNCGGDTHVRGDCPTALGGKKRALVTGVAGFIGSHIADELVKIGWDVYGIDDLSAGYKQNLNPLVKFMNVDITDEKQMQWVFSHKFDVIFHNAASKKTVCLKDPLRDAEVNAMGTLRLLQHALEQKARFVHASTGSVYGEAILRPQGETHPLNPTSYYGVSKLAGEKYVQMYHKQFGLETTILRYFHVYGSRQEDNEYGGVVAIFKKAVAADAAVTVFGDGTQQRSFTHVSDVVTANIRAACCRTAIGRIYNCASGLNYTINELAHLLDAKDILYKDWQIGDIKMFDVDNRAIIQDLGLDFKSLEDGLWV